MEQQPTPSPDPPEVVAANLSQQSTTDGHRSSVGGKGSNSGGTQQRRRSSIAAAMGILSAKSLTFPLLPNATANKESGDPTGSPLTPSTPTHLPPCATTATTKTPTTIAAPTNLPPLSSPHTPRDGDKATTGTPRITPSSTSDTPTHSQSGRRRSSIAKTILDVVGRAASDGLLLVNTVRRSSISTNKPPPPTDAPSSTCSPDTPAMSVSASTPAVGPLPPLIESQVSDMSLSPPPSIPSTPAADHKNGEKSPTHAPLDHPKAPTASGDNSLISRISFHGSQKGSLDHNASSPRDQRASLDQRASIDHASSSRGSLDQNAALSGSRRSSVEVKGGLISGLRVSFDQVTKGSTSRRGTVEGLDDILAHKSLTSSHSSASMVADSLHRLSFRGHQLLHGLGGDGSSSQSNSPALARPDDSLGLGFDASIAATNLLNGSESSPTPTRLASKMSMRASFRAIRSGIFGGKGSGSNQGTESQLPNVPPPYLSGASVGDLRKYPLLRKVFLKYCDAHYPCQEKILFLVALDEFLVLPEEDVVLQTAKIQAINSEFILEGSKHDIGLGRVIRNTILKRAERYLQQASQFWGTSEDKEGGSPTKHPKGKGGDGAGSDDDGDVTSVNSDDSSDDDDGDEPVTLAAFPLPTLAKKEVYDLAEKEVEEYLGDSVLSSFMDSDEWNDHIKPWTHTEDDDDSTG